MNPALMFAALRLNQRRTGAAPAPVDPEPSEDITVVLAATRTTGPAPLAVVFDAVGTTSTISGVTDTFRQLVYTFDYDDPGAGNFPNGDTRTQDVGGPVAAHVFETPGTYTVRCTASRGADSAWDEIEITVTDPDTVYSGTNTIFVSPAANYTGAPSGATTQTTMPTIASNMRVMCQRGESVGNISVPHGAQDWVICSRPGSGDPATIGTISVGTGGLAPNANFPARGVVHDFIKTGSSITINQTAQNITFHKITGGGIQYVTGAALNYWAADTAGRYGPTMPWPMGIVFSECSGVGDTSTYGATSYLSRASIIGCDMSTAQEHTLRCWMAYKSCIRHNALRGVMSDNIRHCLKMHGGGSETMIDGATFEDAVSPATRWVVIADNLFGDDDNNGQITLAVTPQNSDGGTNEGIEDVMVENNEFDRGSNWVGDTSLTGRRITAIGNTLVGGGSASISAPGIHRPGLPDGSGGAWDGPYYTSRT